MQELKINNFLLRETIYSGQFFNFKEINKNEFIVTNGNNIFKIKQIGDTLYFNTKKDVVRKLFGLDFNIEDLENFDDFYFQKAYKKYKGLRIMKIDLFQTIISFVCSAAANQKKIENNIRSISKFFGKYDKELDFYSFPSPQDIFNDSKSDLKLKESKVGYRAKYIIKISDILSENPYILDEIQQSDYKRAHELLMTLPGIGSKVADCICLFALNHFEAFPVDTWIKKMINSWYSFEGNQRELENFVKEKFGNLGGYYQQYLFHLLRDEGL